jgi:soluble P-type ATPase
VLPAENQAEAKVRLLESLGANEVVAIGNGRNDRLMLAAAALGIAVLGDEGAAVEAMTSSDLAVRHVTDAFDLLLEPRRLIASLRA